MYNWRIEIKNKKTNTITTIYLDAKSYFLAEKRVNELYPGHVVVSMRVND
jgi:hypothetical protein